MTATSEHPKAQVWLSRLLSGQPHQVIGGSDDPYLRRWYVIPRNPVLNVYIHQFLRSDDDRALHDHPWWFVSLILKGGYTEVTEHSQRTPRSGLIGGRYRWWDRTVAFRPATFRHRVELWPVPCASCNGTGGGYGVVPGGHWMETDCGACDGAGTTPAKLPCWTLIITGRRSRTWGFWCRGPAWPGASTRHYVDRFVPWHDFGDAGCGER
ncbi:hypothetical protein FZI85_25020 [Mycobacterium sp. CBMA293]|uniref:hypothetical protein n=1 Tax=unclassified Mycolicibacterium TaxID=2636767 RepID=UPI0012DECB4C|nr:MULTISPECIES: hypothetical protein [unclassified Mycolicibacterium]MUL47579.1 hypothetical protein [Mycolicibacterium sp. CBMA 360]MUL61903.1 hypothetical protein [Mycolicibacterium sp. CBMA 335]MUL68976.1 hypothetical protein [Mycolicibacterium sp. CBMA 311]MUL92807.1 hypothetical protein [Mycolicibacterium sp. CBMA 230]MUM08751.1 hypothetical protein [Mycolicibacterium sp. CBMA 213]